MNLTELYRKLVFGFGIYNLVKFVVVSLIIIVILIFFHFPPIFFWFFLLILVLFITLQVIGLKRVYSLNLEENKLIKKIPIISPYKDEKVLDAVFCIIRQSRSGYEILGVGKTKNPENAMLLTNKRVILFAVPVAGEGKLLAGMDFTMMNWMFNKKNIEEKGKIMVGRMTPQQILNHNQSNYEILLNKIKEIKIKSFFDRSVKFTTIDDKKFKYVIKSKDQINLLKEIFTRYLPSKIKS